MPLHNDDDETMMVAQGTYALTKSQKNRKRKYLRKVKMSQVGVPSVKMVVECGHGGPSARPSDSESESNGKELQVGVPPVEMGDECDHGGPSSRPSDECSQGQCELMDEIYETILTLAKGRKNRPVKHQALEQCALSLTRSRDNLAKVVGRLIESGRLRKDEEAVYLID